MKFSPEEAKINTSSLKHDGSRTMGYAFIGEMEGVYTTYRHGEEWILYSVRWELMLGSVKEITSRGDAANLSQGVRGDAAYLNMHAMEEQSQGFTAYLSQKAMVEQTCSLVEDYMGEKEGVECHGSLITYEMRVPTERKIQPTHHRESSMYKEAKNGDKEQVLCDGRGEGGGRG